MPWLERLPSKTHTQGGFFSCQQPWLHYISSAQNMNAPMTFQRALGTKLSPKPVSMPCNMPKKPKQRRRSTPWLLCCQMQPWGLAHTQWPPSWVTLQIQLDIPQTTHQQSNNKDEDELDFSEVHGQLTVIVKDISNATLDSLNLLKADSEFVAPMMVPHIFWHTSTSPPDSLPVQFDCLLDIGSHLVIFHEQLVNDLNLCCHKLQKPIISKLAIQPDGPKVLEFHNFVKLKLYDYSGAYITKTVHTVISPTLCAPVLLGLPFL